MALASPDFQITVSPSTQQLQPGSSVSFAIGIGSIEGFSAPVTLSISGLPAGVSAQFSPNPVNPSGTSILTLTAAADAATGTFAFTITATGGGITHDATGSAKVDFGLVPVCYGKARGIVTDAETGQPIAGATVAGLGTTDVATGADGSYSFDQVPLGENNSAVERDVRASKDPPQYAHIGSYWSATATGAFVCDQTTAINFALVPVHPAHVSGTVYEGNPDPSDYSKVIPTSTPIEGARPVVLYLAPEQPFTTGADGRYDLSFHVGENNTPIDAALFVYGPDLPYRHGYWTNSVNFHAGPDDHVLLDVGLVKQCTASVSGQVVYGDTGLPAADVSVTAGNEALTDAVPFPGDPPIKTDTQGRFSIPEILIGVNNKPVKLGVDATGPTGYLDAHDQSADAIGCGGHWDATVVLQRAATPNFGAVEGHVYDQETGTPIADATVCVDFCTGGSATTNSEGFYRIDRVPVSSDGSITSRQAAIGASHDASPSYYGESGTVEIVADSTAVHDFHLLRRRYGRLTGVVRDEITHSPIAGAVAYCTSAFVTDQDGKYDTGQTLPLNDFNAPTDVSCRFEANGYWYKDASATVRADETTQLDVDLLPVCHATISGTVVDAVTQQPIAGASVAGGGLSTTTGANGDYRLENVTVGYNNSPLDVGVTAFAPGYYTQTKTVTVFCGGTIVVDFGRPSTGRIIVVKRTSPAGSTQSFDFTRSWGSPFSLKDGESFDSGAIAAGSGYSVAESLPLPDGWTQTAATCSDGSPVTNIDLGPGETITCTFTNQQGPPPSTVVVTKSCPNGAAASGDRFQLTNNGEAVGSPLACGDSLDVSVAAGTAYAIDEQAAGTTVVANYTKQLGSGCSGTLASGASANCTITNTLKSQPKVAVTKSCPNGAAASGDRFQLTNNGEAVGSPLACGDSLDVSVAAGTAYAIDEQAAGGTVLANYTKQLGSGCSGTLARGMSANCTITNSLKPGTVSVQKTVSGHSPSGSQSFDFQLREGASVSSDGTIVATGTANAADGGVFTFVGNGVITSTDKFLAGTYQLCELVMPGWKTSLTDTFVPNSVNNPNLDNSPVCVNFTLTPDQKKLFAITNVPPPGGLARTIGFWKNWSSCSGSSGKQKPVLDQTLAAAEPAGVTIGTLTLHGSASSPNAAPDCLKAVRLLNKSTINTGKKMSSDPAFNLAAQLLAAKLNGIAGAGACAAASSGISDAQALLAALHFNGITHDKLAAAQATQANNLATTLDRYNNNLLC